MKTRVGQPIINRAGYDNMAIVRKNSVAGRLLGGLKRLRQNARAGKQKAPGAVPQSVPTNSKPQPGKKLKPEATGPNTGAGAGEEPRAPLIRPGSVADRFLRWSRDQAAAARAGQAEPDDGTQPVQTGAKAPPVASGVGAGGSEKGPPPSSTPIGEFMGSVDEETGEAEAPKIGEFGAEKLGELEEQAATETAAAEESLQKAETDITGREASTEEQQAEGRARLDATVQAADDIAAQAKEDAAQLPGQVQGALEGIADKYKETTDVDIDRIEGLGREAAVTALEGKNAAAQAAVSAQQQAMRAAEAKINADPNIPAGRKSAMVAQLRVNGSMQIATTVGANIKDFTQMQASAMVSTMNAVASASTARNQSLAAMGGAEVQAVAGAYTKAADISAGFDELRTNARQNEDSIRFNYDQLTTNYRDAKDGTSLALLDSENYVSQLPYDFALNHYSIGRDIIGTDFATKLQAGGYNNMQEALAAGEKWAKDATMAQLFMEIVPGMGGSVLGGITMLSNLLSGGSR